MFQWLKLNIVLIINAAFYPATSAPVNDTHLLTTELLICTFCRRFYVLAFNRSYKIFFRTHIFLSYMQLIICSPFFLTTCFGRVRPSWRAVNLAKIVTLYFKVIYRVLTRYFLIKILKLINILMSFPLWSSSLLLKNTCLKVFLAVGFSRGVAIMRIICAARKDCM
jgi:hypothetical protein